MSRRIAITGANRGIGLALTEAALRRGDHVFALCREPERAVLLHALATDYPETLRTARLELLDESSYEEAARAIDDTWQALDRLINNAGRYISHPAVQPREDHRSVRTLDGQAMAHLFAVNSIGPLLVTGRMLPLLERGSSPCVAFVSSRMGSLTEKAGGGTEYTYSASKSALNMLSAALANELRGTGIAVVTMSPGWVATDMGGDDAPRQPDEVAAPMLEVMDRVDLASTGRFINWDGKEIPW